MPCHSIHSAQKQHKWNNAIPPVLTIQPGDTVTFDGQDCSNGQLTYTSTSPDLLKLDFDHLNPIFGPVHITGAEPGDALEVEILDLDTRNWGFTLVFPGFGLLADEFPEPHLKIWDIPTSPPPPQPNDETSGGTVADEQQYLRFSEKIHIPKRPFMGIMGVAPGADGDHGTIPPLATGEGGNIDCRHLTKGTKILFPVRVEGAKFSCGDGHAAQGDGEVCGSAVETAVKATLRFGLRKKCEWVRSVHFLNKPEEQGRGKKVVEDRGRYSVMGVDPDLLEATKKATRYMIEWLVATKGLSKIDAYTLCSVAMDLRIAEAVDINYAVTASVELSIFLE